MFELILAAPVAYWGYSAGARFYLRRLRKRPQAERIDAFEKWSTNPLSPVKLEARILHAEALRDHNAAEALNVLRPAMEVPGLKAVPALLLAGRWADFDRWHGHADEHYKDALSRLSGKKHAMLRGRIQRFRAESALTAGRTDEAIEHLAFALKENEYDQESRLLHAAVTFGAGRLDDASADFDFFETYFGNAALRTRAVVCATHIDVLRGDYDTARRRLDKVKKDLPAQAGVLLLRSAIVEAFAGRADAAWKLLEDSGADMARRTYAEGVIFAVEENWDTAQRRLSESLLRGTVVDPFSSEALWVLEGVLEKAGRHQQAGEIRSRLKDRWPHSPYLASSSAFERPSDAATSR